MQLLDTSAAIVHFRSANVPAGDVVGTSGVIIGTDLDGQPMSIGFSRDLGARLTIELAETLIGDSFCDQTRPNSTGQIGRVRARGSVRVVDNDFTLIASALPSNSFMFFFVGTSGGDTINNEGYRVCVGGNIGRFVGPGQIMNTGSDDSTELAVPLTSMPGNPATAVIPGSTFVFQAWHRDIDYVSPFIAHPLTNAIRVTFE